MCRMLKTAVNILSLLPWNAGEFWDRVTAKADAQLDRLRPRYAYCGNEVDVAVRELAMYTGGTLAALDEKALSTLEEILRKGRGELEHKAPYPFSGCGGENLGRICYLACRLVKPEVVIETGVLYGITSAYILQALEQNGAGVLHSVDLPPARDGSDDLAGCLVPNELRRRWQFHRGASRRVLPHLLPSLPRVGLFVHDSLHTYRNMIWEFDAVTPYLTDHAVVVSDDVQTNAAFGKCFRTWPWSTTVLEPNKGTLVGVAVRGIPAVAWHRRDPQSPRSLTERIGQPLGE